MLNKAVPLSLVLCGSLFAANNLLEITPQIGGDTHVDNPRYKNGIDLTYGIKFAGRVAPTALLEVGYDNIKDAKYRHSATHDKTSINRYYLNVVKEFESWQNTSPYILGGIGYEDVASTKQSLDSAPFGQYGIGLRWETFEYLHLKTELRHLINFDGRSDVVAMLGFSIPFGTFAQQEEIIIKEEEVLVEPVIQTPVLSHIHTFSVQFPFDSLEISPRYNREIMDFANYMKENPSKKAIINGYTDSLGSEEYNQNLSEKRAKAIKNKIIEQGVSATRLEAKGHGEDNPIATNETREGRQQNRRVEAEIYH
ncbi:OmpA family protein [Helicobacter mesocricetorum]|uniref:OmpA family protein n=1 Tax=Helicobacter mesocricetorum TaxID=87012 RepID=UPI000CF0AB20|nr:OmpA family protein [Helicobacter mesocricetorum]